MRAITRAGTAIGLNLLFRVPPVPCILATSLDAALLLLLPPSSVPRAEAATGGLVAAVLACFVVDLLLSRPPLAAVARGLVPSVCHESIFSAVSLLGANVMPHNFYLHSALVVGQGAVARRAVKRTGALGRAAMARLCRLTLVDIACALGLALLVNVAVFLVAASTFHAAGAPSPRHRNCRSYPLCSEPLIVTPSECR